MSAQAVCTRFAPSPTGPLHMGSLITALASYLFIRQQQGAWHVRIDDIDPPRAQQGAVEAILASLQAHGLQPDVPVIFQSDHAAAYASALKQLAPHLFYCNCSRRSLQSHPVYPGTCRAMRAQRPDCAIRFDVSGRHTGYEDGFTGRHDITLETQTGDFIVQRRDGLVAYNLATAVDDAAYSHVLRGQDLEPVTPMQITVMEALGLSVPAYFHIPLLCFSDGVKLSKQTHAPALDDSLAATNLTAALQYMNCPPPSGLSVRELLDWGVEHWSLARLPATLPAYQG